MTDETTIYVAVTVVPGAKTAHVEAFTNEGAAEAYVDYAEENAPEGVRTWVQHSGTPLKEEFKS